MVCKLIYFCSEELLAHRPSDLQDHPLSAVRDYLFDMFATTLHIGGRSICNLRTRHAVVAKILLSWITKTTGKQYLIFEAGGKYNYHCALKGEDVGLIGGSQCDGYRDYSLLVVTPCSLVEIYRRFRGQYWFH